MSKTAYIITGVAILAAGGGYLYYRSKKNEAEGKVLLDFLQKSVDKTNATAAATQQISAVKALKADPSRVRIGRLTGKLTDPAIRNAFAKANVEIRTAVQGLGTDTKALLPAIGGLKSKNSLMLMDKVMKAQYGEGLFEMLKGEKAFFSTTFCQYSEKTSSALVQMFPMFSGGCWVPWFAEWLYSLPDY